jgi:hypothetical protein
MRPETPPADLRGACAMLWIETKTFDDAKLLYDRMWGVEIREEDDITQLRVRGDPV